jgi:hypothetical protein
MAAPTVRTRHKLLMSPAVEKKKRTRGKAVGRNKQTKKRQRNEPLLEQHENEDEEKREGYSAGDRSRHPR